jgi:hypothetical protein
MKYKNNFLGGRILGESQKNHIRSVTAGERMFNIHPQIRQA